MNASTIKRGSLYLTDDFVQALTYNTPAQISSYALLNLPDWGTSGMLISADKLGLAAGIVNPNVLLPAVFLQYWFNLAAYARQFHAGLSYGEDIEDFSEQAFWKCLKRIMPNTAYADMKSIMVSKSTDVLTNTNSVDGNMYMELLLSVNSTLTKISADYEQSKPAYLQTISKLPTIDKTSVIGGNSLALYDIDKTYYDIANAECVKAKFAAESTITAFEYNAILLYYSVSNANQVAGIFFPNEFVQVNESTWTLPRLTKLSDVSTGYSINIKYNAGIDYEYKAANADTGNAMQIYNSWYKAMSKANWQIDALTKTVTKQGEDIDSLRAMFDGGFISSLYNKVENLNQLVSTTYQGSVSTNKLLELFIQAKQNTGNLTLSLLLSDLSKTITSRDIKVTMPTGSYLAGDIIPIGSSITDILAAMLTNGQKIIYTAPSGSLSSDDIVGTVFIDYGSTSVIPLQIALSVGDSGGFALPAQLQLTYNGHTDTMTIDSDYETYSYVPVEPMSNILLCKAIIQYADGQLKPGDIDGIDKILAGYLTLELRIIPTYQLYHYASNLFETLDSIVASDLLNWELYGSNAISNVLYSEYDYQMLAMPANVNCPITNVIIGTKAIELDGIPYIIYMAKTRYLTIDTANLR